MKDNLPIIDMHVHIVGNGSGGTGCWVRASRTRRLLQTFMCRHIGLKGSDLEGDLDRLYIEELLKQVLGSSLDAIVILAMERVYDSQGKCLEDHGTSYVPNDYVLALARKHPEFLPAVSIHPARPDALEELERCIAEGAVMMKCLPSVQNIDCRDRRYTKFWERMAEAGLPLLSHTGTEFTLEVIRPEFADPAILSWPLECGVTVIAAHCATRCGLFDRQFFHAFSEMTRRYPRLYGDVSAFNTPMRGSVVPACLEEPLLSRLVHGSDYPVPVFGHWAWMRDLIDWEVFRKWERQSNVLERDYQIKRAMGFPPETFTRINGLLPAKAPRQAGAVISKP
ncbi:MAG: amidohydrolase family protein [Verrucomicrobia bacterium]|nr:amidohydrolase family protein [Verrucomicrobiota bacterium]